MRKYFAVAKTLFKAQIVYRFDVFMTALGTVWRIIFAWILWGAVYATQATLAAQSTLVAQADSASASAAGGATLGGFTFQAMLGYYIVASFLASLDLSGGVSGEVNDRIRGGTFSKYMVVPSNPQLHFLAQSFGASGYYALFSVAAAAACAVLFRAESVISPDPARLLVAAATLLVGLAFMSCYHYFIGILAFKFQDIGFFLHVQGSLIEFAKGAIVPLALLPAGALAALRFLPFAYAAYMPAMLICGRADVREGLFGLAVAAAWLAAIMLVNEAAYRRLRTKFDGVGI